MSSELVILVDAEDRPLGTMEKLQAHVEGRLHRAFSVFLFDRAGHLLMQKRAASKYHSAGLWSNTCCGHPRPDEPLPQAAARRLFEEMGMHAELRALFPFVYRAKVGPDLVEHEVDHLFIGRFEGTPRPDAAEVSEWKWMEFAALREAVKREPGAFTAWLRLLLDDEGATRALTAL